MGRFLVKNDGDRGGWVGLTPNKFFVISYRVEGRVGVDAESVCVYCVPVWCVCVCDL
jgi:hypothetical protein